MEIKSMLESEEQFFFFYTDITIILNNNNNNNNVTRKKSLHSIISINVHCKVEKIKKKLRVRNIKVFDNNNVRNSKI